jgi:tetratricopeptide (TPR) repeat protein
MDVEQRDKQFRRGLSLCRKGMLSQASAIFQHLVDDGSDLPSHLSYCGLLTAIVHGKQSEGLALCERALCFGALEPDIVLNLARVYERCGERQKALNLLRRALRDKPRHRGLLKRINRLSPRRRRPLRFLHRDHFLNKQIAILLAKMTGRYGAESCKDDQRACSEATDELQLAQ